MNKIQSIFFTIALLLSSSLFAKEPENIIIGAGVGAGQINLSVEHAQIMRHPILGGPMTATPNQPLWAARYDSNESSWATAWEFLVGYKHFINDFVGLRYYANVGIQHYKSVDNNGKKTQPIGLIDYTLNADLLLDFYESEKVAFGIFGGVGFGGTSFVANSVNYYLDMYNTNEGIPIGASDITKHFVNINASVGVRIVFFQKRSIAGGIRMCDSFSQDRRSCSTPSSYMGHSIELSAKFPVVEYNATDSDVMASTTGANAFFVSRPGYKIKNPYRFTIRYIVEF